MVDIHISFLILETCCCEFNIVTNIILFCNLSFFFVCRFLLFLCVSHMVHVCLQTPQSHKTGTILTRTTQRHCRYYTNILLCCARAASSLHLQCYIVFVFISSESRYVVLCTRDSTFVQILSFSVPVNRYKLER